MERQYSLDLPRIPLLPAALLRQHKVFEPHDTRFRAAARLLQALWREDRDLPLGAHVTAAGHRRKLGSRITPDAGDLGANFMSPAIAQLVARELAYREPGALIDEDRLRTNLLASMPLTFNLLGILKLDLDLASRTIHSLWPALMQTVDGIYFEHSPGRGDLRYTGDYTAFDAFITGRSPSGERTFIAVEVKYAETMWEPTPTLRPRLDDLAEHANLFIHHDSPQLRAAPLQQLWRQHLLAAALVANGHFDRGSVVVIAPALNNPVHFATRRYRSHLRYVEQPKLDFDAVTLERFIFAIAEAGAADYAQRLFRRYCDFLQVDGELSIHLAEAYGDGRKPARKVPQLTQQPSAIGEGTDTSAAA